MSESLHSKYLRWSLNFFPCYRRTGAHVTYISHDISNVTVKLPLNWKTKNYVGTIFGGSLYGAVDPIYMIMLMKILGKDYIVWDKAANIRFKKPGRTTLYAYFSLSAEEINFIKKTLIQTPKLDRIYTVDIVDSEGKIYASIEKTLYIRKK